MNIKTQDAKEFIDSLSGEILPLGAGASFGIINEGKLVYTSNYGFSDIGKFVLCHSKTNYRLASVTKQFTAVCILQLVDTGIISLRNKISKFFPEFYNGQDISIFHLLTHTSGLPDFEDSIDTERKEPIRDEEVYQFLAKGQKHKFPPSTKWDYNNGGYCILKQLVEKVSKLSFEEYVQNNIFSVLGMNDSFFMNDQNKGKNRAYGYKQSNGKLLQSDYNAGSFTLGDGGIYSSVEDLCKWIVYKNKILSSEMYRLSNTGLVKKESEEGYYGCGQNIIQKGENTLLIHAGYTQGFRSSICISLEKQLGIIFLSNYHIDIPDEDYGSIITQKILDFIVLE